MGKMNPKVDQYIAKSADFAKPILSHFRRMINFWKGRLLFDGKHPEGAMGQFGPIASLSGLPSDKKILKGRVCI